MASSNCFQAPPLKYESLQIKKKNFFPSTLSRALVSSKSLRYLEVNTKNLIICSIWKCTTSITIVTYIYPILNHLTVSVSSRVIGLIMHDIYVVSISFFQDYHYNHFNWNMVCPVSVCFWHVLSFAMYAQTSMWWPCATSDQTSQCWLPILPCYR